MSDNDGTFPGPDDFQEEPDDSLEETVGEALADYLGLIDETIRIQLTDDDIRDWARRAMDLAASGPDPSLDHVRGPDFSDRHLLRDELMALMGDPQQGPVVLAGPGGAGKTTMATDLAEHARALGQDVWWISAADPVTLLRGLAAVARQLGTADDVDAIASDEAGAGDRFWRLLENARSEWLLIFDEADDPQVLAVERAPPAHSTGHLVLCNGVALGDLPGLVRPAATRPIADSRVILWRLAARARPERSDARDP